MGESTKVVTFYDAVSYKLLVMRHKNQLFSINRV